MALESIVNAFLNVLAEHPIASIVIFCALVWGCVELASRAEHRGD